MIKRTTTLSMAAGLAFALPACGETSAIDEQVVADAEEAVPVLVLTPNQRTNYERLDREEVRQEYGEIREEAVKAIRAAAPDADAATDDNTAKGEDTAEMSTSWLRDEMDFSFLDRNDDGQLSVAEFAIWKMVPLDLNETGRSDAQASLTDDEIDDAARSFFYYDTDGNSYLDPDEFSIASGQIDAPALNAETGPLPILPDTES